jgi:lipoprotein-anchoring transpeptidase ErfK/SrfK
MTSKIQTLFAAFGILTLILLTQSQWPIWFSKQDPINPELLTDSYDPSQNLAIFNNQPLSVPSPSLLFPHQAILGDTDQNSNKRIEVDLTNQRVHAYEGDREIYNFLISSGTYGRTPNGTFTIWTKIRSQKMSGGSRALGNYYYLPNVPYIMFFYNESHPRQQGFSLHGTYWHNNFGVPMSHGCVNMKTEEAALMFNWAEVGTPITIYGKYQTKLPTTKSISLR